ncbi:hypothetical protein ADS77_21260, partial [Pseudoalteromonas porphyrae]
LHEHADQQQEEVEQEHQQQRILGDAKKPFQHHLRHVLHGQHARQHRREEHQHQQRAGGLPRAPQHAMQVGQAQFTVVPDTDGDGVKHGDGRGLGGRGHATIDAAKDDHGHGQAQRRAARLTGDIAHHHRQRSRFGLLQWHVASQHAVPETEQQHQQHPRQHRRQEGRGDRSARHPAVDDHRGAGRDQQRQHRRGGDQRRGIAAVVAALHHARDHDLAHRGYRRGGHAR